jgi:hypothetical protein
MTDPHRRDRHDEQQLASMAVDSIKEEDGEAVASVPGSSGHHQPGQRAEVVDAVMDDPRLREADAVSVAVPRGDTEALDETRQHLEDSRTHAAGASVIVEGRPRRESRAGAED